MRRSKIFYVTPNVIINLLRADFQLPNSNIPDNAVVRSVQFLKEKNLFMFVVDHDSFEVIAEGELLPAVTIEN